MNRRQGRPALVVGALALALAAAGCSSSGAGPSSAGSSTTAAGAPGTTTTTASPTGSRPPATAAPASMRAKRYCEVLAVTTVNGDSSAEVYNTFPLNDCPEAQWKALDAKAIAQQEGVTVAVLNGPRYWLMDRIEKEGATAGGKKDFGGMEMYRQANVQIGSLADAAKPYQPHAVDRKTVFDYDAGRTVYELVDPDGKVYVMQSWSQQADPNLAEGDLAGLAGRLKLPAGWAYRTRTLAEPLRVDTTATAAQVLQDDLRNSYSLEAAS